MERPQPVLAHVREALFRQVYRGVIVWNTTQKRDRWGQHRVINRPPADWLSVPAPQLRIVSDDLWARAHARLSAARAVYKGSGGRPAVGNQSPYLLTNLALCGLCSGGLHVRSRKHSDGRRFFLGCSNYHFRGHTAYRNRADVPMEDADAVVLEALLDDVLDPDLLEQSVDEALALVVDDTGTPIRLPRSRPRSGA